MAQNYRTDRHLNPVALTTAVAKSLGWKQGTDYEVGDSFKTESGSVLHTARLKVPEGMSALEFTKKKFDDSYNSGADVFYTKSGQPRWTHTALKKEDWQKMDDNAKLSTIAKMYKNEGGSGELSKGVTYAKETGMIEKGLKTIGNFLLPGASASNGKGEPMYAGDFKPMDDMPMGSGGFVAKKAPQLDMNNEQALADFVDGNGGFDRKDQHVWNQMKAEGLSDLEALGVIAQKHAYLMENPEKTLESSYVPEDGEQPTNKEGQQASEIGRFGVPNASVDFMGNPEKLPREQVEAAKERIKSLPGGWNEIADTLGKAEKIDPANKEALTEILKEEYAKYVNSDQATQEKAASRIRGIVSSLAKGSTEERARIEQEVFGMGGASSDNWAEKGLSYVANAERNVLNTLGLNIGATAINAAEKLANAESGWEAGNALLQAAGGAASATPIGALVSSALTNIAKTDAGASALQAVMSVPGAAAEGIVSLIGVPEEQKAEAIAFVRDLVTSMGVRGVTGAFKGAKAGLNASPAASSSSKVGSALLGSAKAGIVEGAKGILDPFKFFSKGDLVITAGKKKIVDDAAKRVKTAAVNAKSIGGTAAKLDEAALTDAAASISELRKMGFEVNDAKGLMDAVEAGGDAIFNKANDVLKGKKIDFDGDQLAEGISLQVKNKLGHELSDSAKASIADAVKQIDDNISSGGKVVANYDKLHKVTQALYDTILNSKNGDKFRSVDAPEVYLAAKEVLYKQLSKVKGFEQYLDSYQKLSRLKDLAMLIEKKFGSDVANKPIQELVPPSWIGIMAGSAASGNGWITASAMLAGLANYTKSLKKSPTQMFKDLDKVSRALDAAGEGGYDALNSSLGITKKPLLGQDAVDITKLKSRSQKAAEAQAKSEADAKSAAEAEAKRPTDFTDLAGTAKYEKPAPQAHVEKTSFMPNMFQPMNSGFDVGTPVSTPGKAPTGPQFGQPGFAESIGVKPSKKKAKSDKKQVPAPVKKVATKKAEVKKAAPKPVTAPKKAVAKPQATQAPEKPKTAPKAKETVKEFVPAKVDRRLYNSILEKAKKGEKLNNPQKMQLAADSKKLGEYDKIKKYLK